MCVFLVDVWVDLENWIPTKEGGLTLDTGAETGQLNNQNMGVCTQNLVWGKHIKGPIHRFKHNRNLVDV